MGDDLTLNDVRIWDPRSGLTSAPCSVVISRGRIERLGVAHEHVSGPVFEGGGRIVVPGFVDAHLHLLMGGVHLSRLDLSAVRSRAAFESAVARAHAALPPDQWLVGVGWDEAQWGGALPDHTWLSPAAGRPVVCHRRDLHAVLVNRAVLEQLSGALAAGNPPGGAIARDAAGRPTGLLAEAAAWTLVNPIIPEPSLPELREALHRACAHLLDHGVTSAGTMEYAKDLQRVLVPARASLPVRLHVTLLDRAWPLDLSLAASVPADDRLAVIGFKAFIDGTLGSSTARMLEPYADKPGTRGLLVELAEQGRLTQWAQCVAAIGLQPAMHAIGDEAVRMALDVLDALGARAEDVRARIEHAQQVHPADIPRFAGRMASMQPLHAFGDTPLLRGRLGEARAAQAYPFRALLDAGATLAFGSDWPVVPPDPLAAIRSAVTGLDAEHMTRRPEQRVTIEEAFRAHTLDAARAIFLDDAGVIDVGAAGDLVCFADDPFAHNWQQGVPAISAVIAGGRIAASQEGVHS